jgi:hypothetical protein
MPVLAAAMFLAVRGSIRAVVVWLGALAATLYNAQMLLYATPFNSLFLLYVAMLGLSVWAIGSLLRANLFETVGARVDPRMPIRSISVYLWVIAGVNALVWLRDVVPATLSGDPTTVLEGTGVMTNPVYIQDLALWLPLAIATGVWLWQRRPAGYALAGAVLMMWVFESISIAVDQWFGHHSDPTSPLASQSAAMMFAVLAAVGLWPLIMHLRNIRPPAGAPGTVTTD